MLLLILGVLLWAFSHLMKRATPGLRGALGDTGGKLLVSVLALAAIVLMVLGYRSADVVELWAPPSFLLPVNNLLMLVAVVLVNLQYSRGVLRTKLRHPMLASVKVWAVAHLLVNGDLASVVLFGGLLAWAVLDLIAVNRMVPDWTPPTAGPLRNDLIYGLASLALLGVIGYVHTWLGYNPFG